MAAGGAGHKALLLLEVEEPACYIQDRGLHRWDSCAAEAVIEAHGGMFARLDAFTMTASDEHAPTGRGRAQLAALIRKYRYKSSLVNLDFVPGLTQLTKYNARPGVLRDDDLKSRTSPARLANSVDEVQAYANLCGLLALPPQNVCKNPEERHSWRYVVDAVRKTARSTPPSYT